MIAKAGGKLPGAPPLDPGAGGGKLESRGIFVPGRPPRPSAVWYRSRRCRAPGGPRRLRGKACEHKRLRGCREAARSNRLGKSVSAHRPPCRRKRPVSAPRGKFQEGGRSPILGHFKGWGAGAGEIEVPRPALSFSPLSFGKKAGPPEAGPPDDGRVWAPYGVGGQRPLIRLAFGQPPSPRGGRLRAERADGA